jgi:hypothetical protein
MTVEFDEMAAQQGFATGGAAGGEAYDPWLEWSTMPLDAPVVSHTEFTERDIDYSAPLYAQQTPTETTVVDVKVRDIWNQYGDATPEGQHQINERLYAAGFYTRGTNPEDIDRPTDSLAALNRAISYYATQGVDPLSALPDADPSLFEPRAAPARIIRRATEAQVYSMADSAAKNLLGRNASSEERQLAMSVIRSLETSQSQSPSGADVEAAFAESASGEVSARATEKTLSVFERLVRGA